MTAIETSAGDSTRRADRYGLGAWIAAIGLGTVVTVMATTIVNTALPAVGDDLHASLGSVEWVSTAYLLALTAALPVSAWATDRFGERRVWQTGLLAFVVGSAACAVSPSIDALIAARVVQGVGGGVLLPVGQTVLVRRAPAFRLTSVLATLAVLNLSGPALGPLLGGAIVDHISWRWIFAAVVPAGLAAIVMAAVVLPHAEQRRDKGLDVVGALLVTPAAVLLVLGLSRSVAAGGIPTDAVLALGAGVLLALAYLVHAHRLGPRALLDLEVLRVPGFGSAAVLALTFGVLLFGMLLVLPLLFQATRGASAFTAGVAVVPQAIGSLLVLTALGRRRGAIPLRIVPIGLLLTAVGTLPLVFTDVSTVWIALGLVARGLGLSAVLTPVTAAAYRAVGPKAAPEASTVMNLSLRIGGAAGTALFAALLQRRLHGALDGVDPDRQLAALRHGVPVESLNAVRVAFAGVFVAMTGLALAALVPAVRLTRLSPE